MSRVVQFRETREAISADWSANRGEHKSRIVLFWFRIIQLLMHDLDRPRIVSYPFFVVYRMLTETIFGMELRPTTAVGKGLAIYHGFGLVVNPGTVIGQYVKLRNGVVIGNKEAGGPCPVVGDSVEFGAHAVVLGNVEIGARSTVAAGAVVVKSVPMDSVAIGVPAKAVAKAS